MNIDFTNSSNRDDFVVVYKRFVTVDATINYVRRKLEQGIGSIVGPILDFSDF